MENMDHTEAKRLQAAEKYVMGELTPTLRDEYEEHYFDCFDCAQDVKAATMFVATGRQIFLDQGIQPVRVKNEARTLWRWVNFLRPAYAAPVFAVLLIFIGYQNLVTIPAAKEHAAQTTASAFHVKGNVRGDQATKIVVAPKTTFALALDFTASKEAPQYVGQLQDEAGKTIETFRVPGNVFNQEFHRLVQGGVDHPGDYSLIFTADPNGTGEVQKADPVLRFNFKVEFSL
jgi:hypothetical protein